MKHLTWFYSFKTTDLSITVSCPHYIPTDLVLAIRMVIVFIFLTENNMCSLNCKTVHASLYMMCIKSKNIWSMEQTLATACIIFLNGYMNLKHRTTKRNAWCIDTMHQWIQHGTYILPYQVNTCYFPPLPFDPILLIYSEIIFAFLIDIKLLHPFNWRSCMSAYICLRQ